MQEVVVREIDELVTVGERLSRAAAGSSRELGPERIEELFAIASRGGQLIRRLYGAESHYERSLQKVLATSSFSTMHSNHYEQVSELVGILKGVQHDVHSGLPADLRRLLQAEIFADFLEMAEHLLDEGYKDASAVLLGAILEDSLRKLAAANGLPTHGADGRPFTINPLNVALSKAGAYSPLVQKQVSTWASLRNDAAHGHFANYDLDQVRQMLLFVQKFSADHLR